MNKKLDIFKSLMKDRAVTVLGIGISNTPLIDFLLSLGARVSARDKKSEEKIGVAAENLRAKGVNLVCGDDYLENLEDDYIFKTPGMRFDVPQLEEARARGAHVTSEMEVFFDLCPAKIVAVTGSDGKTTTTTLIYKILCAAGHKCRLGGNIGMPLLPQIADIGEDEIIVLELSSFQLHTMRKSPNVAVITNISPNHLDMHKSYEEYIEAKKNIFLYQGADDVLVLNASNAPTFACAKGANGTVKLFGHSSECNAYSDAEAIYRGGERVIEKSLVRLSGEHNIENLMAAMLATETLAPIECVKEVAQSFGGVEHRMEFIREKDGVRYYNSSIDSSPNRTMNALSVFKQKVILIAGGKDKGIPFDAMGGALAEHVKTLILIGKTASKIHSALKSAKGGENVEVIYCETYEQIVETAARIAKSGDIVILSPASTSFDMFANFEERGNVFKALVNAL